MATDTGPLLRHLAEETRRTGAEVRFEEPFEGAAPGRIPLTIANSGDTCRFLVGADGARSKVIRRAYPSLAVKRAARWCFDHLPVARALEAGLLTRGLFRGLAEAVFFSRAR